MNLNQFIQSRQAILCVSYRLPYVLWVERMQACTADNGSSNERNGLKDLYYQQSHLMSWSAFFPSFVMDEETCFPDMMFGIVVFAIR